MITQENKDQLRFLARYNMSKAHNVYSKKDISDQTALPNLLTVLKILFDAIVFAALMASIYIFMYAIGGVLYA
tara:strand:- start:122 stop:340 length:219 start_codon:yes stop_codon:yes gene_type:complete